MKVGTKSLIFGVHQVFIHTYMVIKAWNILYKKRPTVKELLCIIVHDWGYWGKKDMDGSEGSTHPELGAKIAGRLLGPEYRDLCLYHSRDYAKRDGKEPSKLCWADKYSLLLENESFYLMRAKASGELQGYRQKAAEGGFVPLEVSDVGWLRRVAVWLGYESMHESEKFK